MTARRWIWLGFFLVGPFVGPCRPISAEEMVFAGPWHTTNRKLDGVMTCTVTRLDQDQWRGRFVGIWQGVPFDYTVAFEGPPDQLQGTATIDGANYHWTGALDRRTPGRFTGTFGGSRYEGYFDLKEKWR